MYNANIKTEIINNIIFEMSGYVDNTTLDIMQKVIEKQLVAVNMEEITNLPVEIRTSAEEQNRYYISLMMIKKKNLRPRLSTMMPLCVLLVSLKSHLTKWTRLTLTVILTGMRSGTWQQEARRIRHQPAITNADTYQPFSHGCAKKSS